MFIAISLPTYQLGFEICFEILLCKCLYLRRGTQDLSRKHIVFSLSSQFFSSLFRVDIITWQKAVIFYQTKNSISIHPSVEGKDTAVMVNVATTGLINWCHLYSINVPVKKWLNTLLMQKMKDYSQFKSDIDLYSV